LQTGRSTSWDMPPVHFAIVLFWKWGLMNYLPWMALNHDPPDLNLLSS
jgi:hypothetical protein